MPKAPSFKKSKSKKLKVKVIPKERRVKKTAKGLKLKKLKGDDVLCAPLKKGQQIVLNVAANELENPFPPSVIGSHRRMITVGDNGHTVVGEMQAPFNKIPRSGHMNPVQFCQAIAAQFLD